MKLLVGLAFLLLAVSFSADGVAQTDSSAFQQIPPSPEVDPQVSYERGLQRPDQLTPSERGVSGHAQVNQSGRTAQAPDDLSSRSDGRPTGEARIGGHDRCEPGSSHAASATCRSVIESRADQFERPEPSPLTAEQRLLVFQHGNSAPTDSADASRRLATGRGDDMSTLSQAIAATALSQDATPSPTPAPEPGAMGSSADILARALQ